MPYQLLGNNANDARPLFINTGGETEDSNYLVIANDEGELALASDPSSFVAVADMTAAVWLTLLYAMSALSDNDDDPTLWYVPIGYFEDLPAGWYTLIVFLSNTYNSGVDSVHRAYWTGEVWQTTEQRLGEGTTVSIDI